MRPEREQVSAVSLVVVRWTSSHRGGEGGCGWNGLLYEKDAAMSAFKQHISPVIFFFFGGGR